MFALLLDWNGQFQRALEAVPPQRQEDPVTGERTVKDLLAQLAWYDPEMAAALQNRQLPEMGLWELPRLERDHQISAASRSQSWEELRTQRDEAHRSLVQEIERLDEEDLNDPSRFQGIPAEKKLWEVLEGNTWSQYMARAEALWTWWKIE